MPRLDQFFKVSIRYFHLVLINNPSIGFTCVMLVLQNRTECRRTSLYISHTTLDIRTKPFSGKKKNGICTLLVTLSGEFVFTLLHCWICTQTGHMHTLLQHKVTEQEATCFCSWEPQWCSGGELKPLQPFHREYEMVEGFASLEYGNILPPSQVWTNFKLTTFCGPSRSWTGHLLDTHSSPYILSQHYLL